MPDGGGAEESADREGATARGARQRARQAAKAPPAVPDTEATRLLKTINVRPEQLIELAEMSVAPIQAAIADGQAHEGIRDLAGWVVSLLRAHRDHGWTIQPPAPRPDSPEALRAAFARYAAEQESARREGLPEDEPWFPPPAPAPLDLPGALQRLWNEVQATLKAQTTRREFDTWIRRAALLGVAHGVATIVVPNATVKDAIERRFLGQLRDLLTMHVGEAIEVRVILNPHAPEASALAAAPRLVALDSLAATAGDAPAGTHPETAAPPSVESCPAWIAAERWVELPIMLRAALAGSELVDGEVRGRTPYLSTLLRTRYAREVDALIAAR